jgi:hypothetical protein
VRLRDRQAVTVEVVVDLVNLKTAAGMAGLSSLLRENLGISPRWHK